MYEQTGKVPGGPTGFCHKVVVGALTGYPLDFQKSDTVGAQQLEESFAGLQRYPVVASGKLPKEVIPNLLEQSKLTVKAVLIYGKVKSYPESHIVAVAPEDGQPPYHVIDSLLPNATTACRTPEETLDIVTKTFDPHGIRFAVIPEDSEIETRQIGSLTKDLIVIKNGVIVEAPPKHRFLKK